MYLKNDGGIDMQSLYRAVEKSLEDKKLKKFLFFLPIILGCIRERVYYTNVL